MGYYDVVIEKKKVTLLVETFKCSCRKNDKFDNAHCNVIKHQYTELVRCVSLKKDTTCIVNCQCKHCDIPHGKRVIGFTPQRKLAKHEWQAQINMSNTEFAKGKVEELSGGPQ